jgi:hypothetical protein
VLFIGLQDYKLPGTDQIQTELVQAGSKHDVRYTDVFLVFSAWKRHIGVIDNIQIFVQQPSFTFNSILGKVIGD